jgi:hypothetical protein
MFNKYIFFKFWVFKVKKLTLKDDKEFWRLYKKLENPETIEQFLDRLIDTGLIAEFLRLIIEDTIWNKILKKLGLKYDFLAIDNDKFLKIVDYFFVRNQKSMNILLRLLTILGIGLEAVKMNRLQ